VRLALGVTGCIAAYKAIDVMRGLQKAGVSVQVILTRSALEFVAPLPFESLSQRPVITGMFQPGDNRAIEHIRVAQESELLAVVPATANIIGKFAAGIADDFLSTLYLACPAPVVMAPAMNVNMWTHPAVRENIGKLRERGVFFIDPESGPLACGMQGEGRLAEVDVIVDGILGRLKCDSSMAGLKVLITAGPTIEDIDPVRFISNRSSGKMGFALARVARLRGADVTLISGPTELVPPAGVNVQRVRSAGEMSRAVMEHFADANIVIMSAAVADYTPASVSAQKIKKGAASASIDLVPTEDILASLGSARGNRTLVGFAAETENLVENARGKLERKKLDMIVANDVSSGVFGCDSAAVQVILPGRDPIAVGEASKFEIAGRIIDVILQIREDRPETPGRRAL
jgi:phosphopantothenoylcysteine decarboxylase / phosphopantothenate---cysteine ligase